MEPKELIAKRNDVQAKLDSILAKDQLSAEERAEVKTLEAEFDQLSADIVETEKLAADDAEARKRNKARTEQLNRGKGRRTETLSSTPATDTLGNPRESFEEDPKKGFKSHNEFLQCVIDAGQARPLDHRLQFLAAGSDEARGNNDPSGGFLVPIGFSPDFLKITPENDPIGPRTRKIPMNTTIVKIPARSDKNHTTSVSGGLTVTRKPQTVAATASQMTMEQVVLEAHSLFGLSYATEELLMDSPQSFVAILSSGFAEQFAYQLIAERIGGTGVGEYTGVLNAGCTVSVAKETKQAATTLIYENVLNMRSRCWGYDKAVWIANHDTMPQLMLMNQGVGTGGVVVWQPSAREDAPDMLLGRPIYFSEYPQTLGTTGDIILGNWSEYLEGTYEAMNSAESIHVRFVNHERAFKFWTRNAGTPWWRVAITPKVSSKTLSPFVICDTRS